MILTLVLSVVRLGHEAEYFHQISSFYDLCFQMDGPSLNHTDSSTSAGWAYNSIFGTNRVYHAMENLKVF